MKCFMLKGIFTDDLFRNVKEIQHFIFINYHLFNIRCTRKRKFVLS